jgi:hypothetical protein
VQWILLQKRRKIGNSHGGDTIFSNDSVQSPISSSSGPGTWNRKRSHDAAQLRNPLPHLMYLMKPSKVSTNTSLIIVRVSNLMLGSIMKRVDQGKTSSAYSSDSTAPSMIRTWRILITSFAAKKAVSWVLFIRSRS